MNAKGQIWVSAVLYVAIGVIVLSLLLTAAVPLINKMKDRNTVVNTKDVLFTIDETIKTVATEGPGSQRELTPLVMKAGQLVIDEKSDRISWSLETNAVITEPDTEIEEGAVTLLLESTPIVDKYVMHVNLTYLTLVDLKLISNYQNPFSGTYSMSIRHTGNFTPGAITDMPVIEINIR